MKTQLVIALCGFAMLTGCAEFPDDATELPSEETATEEFAGASGPSAELLEEAERFLAAIGGITAAKWKRPRLTGEAIALYRPDMESPAYYELPVHPEGFVVVATGDHDWKISHWASKGSSPSARLRKKAAASGEEIAKYYKLDTLSYAAEDASGRLVSQLGALPPRIRLDPAQAELGGELFERSWLPEVDADGQLVGGEIITREIAAPAKVGGEAGPLWATEGKVVGRELVTGDEVTTQQLFTPNAEARPFESWQELKADYADTFRPHLKELRSQAAASAQLVDLASAPTPTEGPFGAEKNTGYENGYYWWSADGNAAELTYGQIGAHIWPNTSSCSSGCGATAWSMLFAWADREAAAGSPKWQNHGGIYRQGGGYGIDVTAPTDDDAGTNNMTIQIRALIKTFCWFNNGATYPGDMIGAWNYLVGRDHSPLHTTYNTFGFANGGNSQAAVDVILGEKSPVIIGTGWLTHYPLAHAFAWHPEYGSFFIVNQGWHYGGAEGVPASTWFHGQIVWVP